MNWHKKKNVFVFETGKKIVFDFPIKCINEGDEYFEINLDVPDKFSTEANNFMVLKKEQEIQQKDHMQYPEPNYIPVEQKLEKSFQSVLDWAKEDNVLVLGIDKRISFDYSIKSILETENIIIVVLDVPPKLSMTENVFGVSAEGNIIWQIERIPETANDPVNCYVGLSAHTLQSKCFVTNWNCICATVDIKTGKVLDTQFTK
jgi:hypothetical protein